MIVLDTHIWVWWVHGDERLSELHSRRIQANESDVIGVSAISLWEVAKLVQLGRLTLPVDLPDWFAKATAYPGVSLIGLTPAIAIESTRLPDRFHRDPADQVIVATSRVVGCELLTADQRIRNYPHVPTPWNTPDCAAGVLGGFLALLLQTLSRREGGGN